MPGPDSDTVDGVRSTDIAYAEGPRRPNETFSTLNSTLSNILPNTTSPSPRLTSPSLHSYQNIIAILPPICGMFVVWCFIPRRVC